MAEEGRSDLDFGISVRRTRTRSGFRGGLAWKTVDEKSGKVTSEVEIYEQSGKLFDKIVSLTEPNDKQGKPKICIACAGADKNKPIVGLVILRNLSADGDRYKGGTILDPEDGKVYSAEVWVEDGKLMVRGYSGFLYKTRTWLKV